MKTTCEQCGCTFDAVNRRGITPRFCSNACRQKAYRARRKKSILPSSLTDRVQWVRAVGKRPIQCDGSPASSTRPDTWATYKEVQSGAGDGYGIMLGNGLGCYDLDHCLIDGVLEQWAQEALETIEEPVVFIEVSVSGSGLHVFVKAEEGRGTRTKIERYTWARFIRVTGNKFIWR